MRRLSNAKWRILTGKLFKKATSFLMFIIAWDGDKKEARVMAGGEVKKWKAKGSSTPL